MGWEVNGSLVFGLLAEEGFETALFRQATIDGGSLWTLSLRRGDAREITTTYGIHPEGHLRSYSFQSSDLTDSVSSTSLPEPSSRVFSTVELRPLEESDPIQPPEVGTPLDLSRFDVPDDFPSPS